MATCKRVAALNKDKAYAKKPTTNGTKRDKHVPSDNDGVSTGESEATDDDVFLDESQNKLLKPKTPTRVSRSLVG